MYTLYSGIRKMSTNSRNEKLLFRLKGSKGYKYIIFHTLCVATTDVER